MAFFKSKKDSIDKSFDADAELDSFDVPDFDLPGADSTGKREPITEFRTGFVSGFKSSLTDTERLRKLTRDTLPSGFGQSMDLYDQFSSQAGRLYDDVHKEIAPVVKDSKRLASRLIKDDTKYVPQWIKDKAKEWRQEGQSSRTQSQQELRDSLMTSELGMIFAEQSAQDSRQRQEDQLQAHATRIKQDQQHEQSITQLDGIRQAVDRSDRFAREVTLRVQKKGLELQYRSLFVQQDMLAKLDETLQVMRPGLENIAKNTGLPDFVKISQTEDFKRVFRGKTFEALHSGLFGSNSSYMNKMFGTLRNNVKGQVSDLVNSLQMGLMQVEMGADMAESMGDMTTKEQMAGNMAGGMVGGAAGARLAKWIRKNFVDGNKTIEKADLKLRGFNENLTRNFNEFASDGSMEFEEGPKGFLWKLAQWLKPSTGVDTGIVTSSSKNLNEPYAWTRRTDRTINEVMPQLTARLLREMTMLRTGEDSAPLLVYDFDKGVFASDKSMARALRKKVLDSGAITSTTENLDSMIKEIDPKGVLSQKQREAMREMLFNNSTGHRMLTRESIRKNGYVSDDYASEADTVRTILEQHLGGLDAEALLQFQYKHNRLANNAGDPRQQIQDYVDAGYTQQLLKAGVIRHRAAASGDVLNLQDKDQKLSALKAIIDDRSNGVSGEDRELMKKLHAEMKKAKPQANDLLRELTSKGHRALLLSAGVIKPKEGGGLEFDMDRYRQRIIKGGLEDNLYGDDEQLGTTQKFDRRSSPIEDDSGDVVSILLQVHEAIQQQAQAFKALSDKPATAPTKTSKLTSRERLRANRQKGRKPASANLDIEPPVDIGDAMDEMPLGDVTMRVSNFAEMRPHLDESLHAHLGQWWDLYKQSLGILFDELRQARATDTAAATTPTKATLKDRARSSLRGGLQRALSFLKVGKQNDPAAEDGHETNISSVVDGMSAYEQVSLSLMRRIARNTAVMRETSKSQLMFSLSGTDIDFSRMGPWMKSIKGMKIPGMGIFSQEKFHQFLEKSKRAAKNAKDTAQQAAQGQKQDLLKFDGTMAGNMAALGQRAGIAASWATDKLWSGIKYTKNKVGEGLNAGKTWWDDQIFDIYLQGQDKPVMLAKDIRAGHYFDAITGDPITNLASITPAGVKDAAGNFVFPPGSELYAWDPKTRAMRALTTTKAQLKKAMDHSLEFAKKWGPRAFEAAKRVADGWIEGAKELGSAVFGTTKRGLKVLVDPPTDIYVVGDMSAPKLLGVVMSSGGYFSATTGKVIEVPGDIDGPIKDAQNQLRLTTEDLVKGLCDVHGDPIVATWTRVTKMVGATISRARDFGRNLIERGRELLTKGLTGIRQIFGNWSVEFSARKQVGVLQQIRDFMFVKFGQGIDLEQFSDAKYNITDSTGLNVSKGIEAIKEKYEALVNKVDGAKKTYHKWRTGEGMEEGSLSDRARKAAIGGWGHLKQNLSEMEQGGLKGWLALKKEQGAGFWATSREKLQALKEKGLQKAGAGRGKAERVKNFFKNLFGGSGQRFGMTPGPTGSGVRALALRSAGGALATVQRQGFTFGQNDRQTYYSGNTAYGNQARLGYDPSAGRSVGQKYLDLTQMTPPQILSYATHLRDMILEMRDHPDAAVQMQVMRWTQEAERVAKYVKLQQNQQAANSRSQMFQRQLGYNGKATVLPKATAPKDATEEATMAAPKAPPTVRDRIMQTSRGLLSGIGRKFKTGWARVRPGMSSEQATEINTQNTSSLMAQMLDYFRSKDKKAAGDTDGDGLRDGSWQSRLKQMNENRKNRAAKNKGKENTDPSKKADKDNGSWLGALGAIGSIIGGISTAFSALSGVAKMGFGLMRGAGSLGFGLGKGAATIGGSVLGATLKGGGRLLWEAGKFTAMRAIPTMLMGGVSALSATVGAIGGVASGLLGTAAGLIASPIGLAALAAAGVALTGYGIFKGAKWLMRNRMTPLQAIRYVQYGFSQDDNQHWSKVQQTEDMLSPLVTVMNDSPNLDESKVDLGKLMQLWGLDSANEDHIKLFFSWYGDRFRPMFLGHVTAINAMTGSKQLSKADDLEGQKLKAYFQATRFDNGPYGVQYLPLVEQTRQASGPQDVRKTIEWAYNKLEIAKIKAGSDKIIQETTQITSAAGAAVAAGVAQTAGATPVGPFEANQEAKTSKPNAFGFSLGMDGKEVLSSGGGQLKALDAVRFKTYGLIELKTDQVISLRRLEAAVLPHMTAAGSKVQFNGSPTEIMEAVCGLFGFSRASVLDSRTWKAWFEDRFLPTYLTYLSGYYAVTGRMDAAQGAQLLAGKDALTLAMAMVSQTRVWSMSASPWPMYTLGQDPGLASENIEVLKERAKNDKVVQERRDAQDRQLSVTAPPPTSSTAADSAQRAKALSGGPAQGGSLNQEVEAAPNISGAAKGPVAPGSGPIALAEGGINTQPTTTGTFSLNKPGVTLDGIHPVFKVLLYGALQEYYEKTGKKAIITSGFRTYAQQEAEYKANPNKAAKPGSSIHEFGLAVDINSADLNTMDKLGILKKYGLTRPIGGEPWHLEPAGIQSDIGGARKSHSEAARMIRAGIGRGGGGLGTIAGSALKSRDRAHAMAALNAAGTAPDTATIEQAMKKAGQTPPEKPSTTAQQTPNVGQMAEAHSPQAYAPKAEVARRALPSTTPPETARPGYKKPQTYEPPKAPIAQAVAQQAAAAPADNRKPVVADAEAPPKVESKPVARAKERGQDASVIPDQTIRVVAQYAELQYQELRKISQGVDQLVAFAQGQMKVSKESIPAPPAPPRNQPVQGTNVPRAAVSMRSAFSD